MSEVKRPSQIIRDEMKRKQEELALMEKRIELQEGLPFLYGWKWYAWAKEFYDSTNKMNFLCAANQISKSSTQIRKCINWATNRELRQALWPKCSLSEPLQFWYFYPSSKQVKVEFDTKWKQFLPRGKYKTEHVIDGKPNYYQWREEIVNRELFAIHFDVADAHIYFKTYTQDTQNLQTGTCHAIFCDEELPIEHWDELIFRISATDGYFHMVFTATLGQEFWRTVIEPETPEEERLPDAAKWVVSMYDCQKYIDGTPSRWTDEAITTVKSRCKNEQEVLKRVFGRFVRDDGGRKYEAFNLKKHVKPSHPLPDGWSVYVGVDVGAGGKLSHPGAICFVAVSPDFRQGRVFLGWRGDGQETTAGDIFNKFVDLKREHNIHPVLQTYDWASKDFFTIASRAGEAFLPAEKSHEIGEQILNTLFRNDMLFIYDNPDLRKLAQELVTLRKDQPKNKAKDDFADALRYAVTRIPWDWTAIKGAPPKDFEYVPRTKEEKEAWARAQQLKARREAFDSSREQEFYRIEMEFDEANESYGQ